MIRGVDVTVLVPVQGAADRFGNATEAFEPTTVSDVLVAPGATADLEASRPEGATVAFTLHFPKSFDGRLEGCQVELPQPWAAGNPYRVVGCPAPYIDANTPTRWHMQAEVEAAHG